MIPQSESSSSGGIARRSLVKAAWAAPVILVAVGAPAASASTTGVAASIKVLSQPLPLVSTTEGTAFIVVTVLDANGQGVPGLVTATIPSDAVGRFDVGNDDAAISSTMAASPADSSGYVTFSLVGVSAGSVPVLISSGSATVTVPVVFQAVTAAASIQVLNDQPITASVSDTAFVAITVLDSDGNGVPGLVTATIPSSTIGRFDVGDDDAAVTDVLASAQADDSGYLVFSLVGVSIGTVDLTLASGAATTSVPVTFQ